MSSGISIDIAADTKPFVTNVAAMADALEQAAAELDALANSGVGTDEVTERLRQEASAARETAAQFRNTATEFNDYKSAVLQSDAAFQNLSQQTRQIGDETEEMGRKTEDGGRVGSAALTNLGYSSLSAGTLFSGPGGILENLGTFAAFMGPSLLGSPEIAVPLTLIGVALAAVGGLLGQDNEEAQNLAKSVSDLTSEWLGNFAGGDQLDQGLRAWAKDASDFGGITLPDLKEKLKDTGLEFGEVASALATKSEPALKQQKAALDDLLDSYVKQSDVLANQRGPAADADREANNKRIDGLKAVQGALNQEIEATRTADEVHKQVAAQLGLTTKQYDAYEDALNAVQQAQSTFTSSLHSTLETAGKDTSDFSNNGVVDLQKYSDNLNATVQNILNEQANLKSIGPSLSTAGKEYVESLGADAAPLLAEAVKLGPSNPQYQALIDSWNKAGLASSKEFGLSAAQALPKTIDGPSVTLDTKAAKKQLLDLGSQTITVKAKVVDQYGRSIP